ncbi:acetaldehyde dehydrogenase [Paenibacillus sp. FSL R7-277]|uniref:acetaldehyde dehydrogenase (acetylating) n=1 Tax=Paenibacillus sp. FSL R7-277 TaxID=1227352 RepID=UPI0003E228A4|nr:acetaldehyde dehydrogenase (acetylating) [Paenibacillus sp. FSL R7-277]ETT59108.1 acetaldehyde dehydrogenase [Paenibacillus sp. FSL R7-277]
MRTNQLNVAILGSGNIGTDLLIKVLRSESLTCSLFSGRNPDSRGLQLARELGVQVSDRGINAILDNPGCCDIVIDATSAAAHIRHYPLLKELGKFVIDMTPSQLGTTCIPAVNLQECLDSNDVNMITCGGQASVPLAYAIAQSQKELSYIEVVSSIASLSAGPATRINLDEYIGATEDALRSYTGCRRAKAILNLNPAIPSIDMQTTLFAVVPEPDMDSLSKAVEEMATRIQHYVPGYQIIVPPVIENGRIAMMVKVQGLGDFLPTYAGNLDIINCAAIALAEEYARRSLIVCKGE